MFLSYKSFIITNLIKISDIDLVPLNSNTVRQNIIMYSDVHRLEPKDRLL